MHSKSEVQYTGCPKIFFFECSKILKWLNISGSNLDRDMKEIEFCGNQYPLVTGWAKNNVLYTGCPKNA